MVAQNQVLYWLLLLLSNIGAEGSKVTLSYYPIKVLIDCISLAFETAS